MAAEKRVVKLIADVAPAAGAVKREFGAGELDNLHPLRQCLADKAAAQLLLSVDGVLLIENDLGGRVEDAVRDENDLLHNDHSFG